MLVFVDHQKGQSRDTMIFSSINKIRRNQVAGEGLLYLLSIQSEAGKGRRE